MRDRPSTTSGLEIVEDPADVGVPEASQRGVGIVLVVRIGVVLGVGGGPVEGGPLHRHGAGDEKEGFQPRLGLEGLVGEHAVEAEGDAEAANDVHGEEEGKVHPIDPLVPEEDDGADHPDDGQPDEGQKDEFGEGGGRVGVTNG